MSAGDLSPHTAGGPARARGRLRSPVFRIAAVARYELRWDLRKVWFYLALTLTLLFVVLFGAFVPYLILHPPGAGSPPGNATTRSPSSTATPYGNFSSFTGLWWLLGPYALALFFPAFFPLLFGSMSSSESLSRERDQGTLGALLSQPLGRSDVVLGKFFAKAAEFLLLSTILVVGLIVAATIVLGPQQYVWGFPLVVLEVALAFLFFAAFGLMISSVTKRPRPVTLLSLVLWVLVLVMLWLASMGSTPLLPLAYYLPYSSAMLATPAVYNLFVHGPATVPVLIRAFLPVVGYVNLNLGSASGFADFLNVTLGLLGGTVLCLLLAQLGLSATDIRGD